MTEEVVKFEVGQRWHYKTLTGMPSPVIVINRIEQETIGTVLHISVPDTGHMIARHISHLPILEAALRESVTQLVSTGEPYLHFHEGYDEWKRAFDAGKGGVFDITVDEIVESLILTVDRGAPAPPKGSSIDLDLSDDPEEDDGESWKRGIPPVGSEDDE